MSDSWYGNLRAGVFSTHQLYRKRQQAGRVRLWGKSGVRNTSPKTMLGSASTGSARRASFTALAAFAAIGSVGPPLDDAAVAAASLGAPSSEVAGDYSVSWADIEGEEFSPAVRAALQAWPDRSRERRDLAELAFSMFEFDDSPTPVTTDDGG